MGFSFGIEVIGMMTLSLSSLLRIVSAMGGSLIIWENPVGVQRCVDGDLEGAPGSLVGGVGVGFLQRWSHSGCSGLHWV